MSNFKANDFMEVHTMAFTNLFDLVKKTDRELFPVVLQSILLLRNNMSALNMLTRFA